MENTIYFYKPQYSDPNLLINCNISIFYNKEKEPQTLDEQAIDIVVKQMLNAFVSKHHCKEATPQTHTLKGVIILRINITPEKVVLTRWMGYSLLWDTILTINTSELFSVENLNTIIYMIEDLVLEEENAELSDITEEEVD